MVIVSKNVLLISVGVVGTTIVLAGGYIFIKRRRNEQSSKKKPAEKPEIQINIKNNGPSIVEMELPKSDNPDGESQDHRNDAKSPENKTEVSDNNVSSKNGKSATETGLSTSNSAAGDAQVHHRNKSTTETEKPKPLPPFDDSEEMHLYFLDQVRIAEQYLDEGNTDEAIEHFCNAILVCSMFENFLDILKDSLPKDVYNALMERLPEVQKRWEEEIADSVKRNEASTSAAAGEHR